MTDDALSTSQSLGGGSARKLVGHSALYGLAGALGKALALLTVPILTRLLTPAEYGLADLANALAATLAIVATFAGDIPAARLMGIATAAEDRPRILSSYVWASAAAALAVALIVLPFSGFIATDLWAAPGNIGLVLLAVLLVPIGTVQATLVTTQRLQARPLPFAVLATIDLLAQMILAVVFAALGWGPLGVVLGFVVGSFIGLAAAAVYGSDIVLSRPSWPLSREMVVEGLPFVPAIIGAVVANYVVRYLLVETGGQHDVGLFAVAIRLAGGMALVTGAFSMAWGPFGLGLPDSEQTSRLFGRVMRAFALLTVLASLAAGAIAPELISVLSGGAYRDAATMLPGLLVAAALAGGFYVLLVAAGVSRRGRAVGYAAVAGGIVQVAATALLLPWVGLQSVGIGAVLGQGLALIILISVVGGSVHRGREAVIVMCLGGAAAVILQGLNTMPDATFVARLAVAAACLVAGAVLGIRILQRRATVLA